MAYHATAIIMSTVTFVLAYLSTKFGDNQVMLQLFFVILTLGFIPADIAILNNILIDAGAPTTITGIVNGVYQASIWMIVIFIAILMVQFLYNLIVKPVEDLKYDTYNNFPKNTRVMR